MKVTALRSHFHHVLSLLFFYKPWEIVQEIVDKSLVYSQKCKVKTQQAENFDEEVKSLVPAWFSFPFFSFIINF